MSLAEKLSEPPIAGRQFCTVGKVIEELHNEPAKADDLRALVRALEDRERWPASSLAAVLVVDGRSVTWRHVREHRNGHTASQCAFPELGRATK